MATASPSTMAPGLRWADLPAPTVQCHAANLMPLGDGTLGCVWFGGTQEGVADICIWFSKRDVRGVWSRPVQLSSDAARSEQNPILFPAPDGLLWLLHTAQHAGNQDTAIVRCRVSRDHGESWQPARTLFDRRGVFVRQPLVVLTGGAWLLPIFRCRVTSGERWSGDHDDSAVMISRDRGKTWTEHAVPGSTGCVHMNVVASRDRRGLLAFFRSRWADHVWRSSSSNGGRTWSEPRPTPLPNNNSSIQVARLASGALVIAHNHSSAAQATERRASLYDDLDGGNADTRDDRHNDHHVDANDAAVGSGTRHESRPVTTHRTAFWGTPRAPMTLALSDDEGLTWPVKRDLETGDGYAMTNSSADQRNRELSYPSIVQTTDGTLHVAYTHHRQRIRHVTTSESWIRGSASA